LFSSFFARRCNLTCVDLIGIAYNAYAYLQNDMDCYSFHFTYTLFRGNVSDITNNFQNYRLRIIETLDENEFIIRNVYINNRGNENEDNG